MRKIWIYSAGCWLFLAAAAWGQANQQQPHIGYVYPAGGQAGRDVLVTVGGQLLRGATEVYITGEGVHGEVVQHFRALGFLDGPERNLLRARLEEVRDKRLDELNLPRPPKRNQRWLPDRRQQNAEKAEGADEVKMPEHPLLYDLESKSLRELANITAYFAIGRDRKQQNRQIAESVLVRIKVDENAAPGMRELRLRTRQGLTNPIVFEVGTTPEVCELEPNDQEAYPPLPQIADAPKPRAVRVPVTLNGQIMPGDRDRFRFYAEKGRTLVIQVQARSLIPYLADAVPGWFQAVVAVFDEHGRELTFADDYRFCPDPALAFKVPRSGEYELEIRDSIYRGREDFVYRIRIDEQPFVTEVFPLGGQGGEDVVATISGWNLPETQLKLDTTAGGSPIRQAVFQKDGVSAQAIAYAVDEYREVTEKEGNNTREEAQAILLPIIINGRIDGVGDVDVYHFTGRSGETIVAEVMARRLQSPLDSVVRLTDAEGGVLAWNDDYSVRDEGFLFKDTTGLLTHHADSYMTATLAADGDYYLQIADAQQQGGESFAYRLRVSPPRPDFALRVTPSSLSVASGGITAFEVHVLRKDGFNGEIAVGLKDAPSGYSVQGGVIGAGCDRLRMTLTAPAARMNRLDALVLEGRAEIEGKTVVRQATAADDTMQAFLYRHLCPAQEWLVAVNQSRRPLPRMELADGGAVQLQPGGSAGVHVRVKGLQQAPDVQLELDRPPVGISLKNVTHSEEGLTFELSAGEDAKATGAGENLIVEVFREVTPPGREGEPARPKRKVPVCVLPAIPVIITSG